MDEVSILGGVRSFQASCESASTALKAGKCCNFPADAALTYDDQI